MRRPPPSPIETESHITSFVVQVQPDFVPETTQRIEAIDGASIHFAHPDGKLVVVMEADSLAIVTDWIAEISGFPGVLSAVLVYHQIEDTERLEDLIDVEPTADATRHLETLS